MEFNRRELSERLVKEFDEQQEEHAEHDFIEDDEEERKSGFKLLLPLIAAAALCFGAYAWYTDKIAISSNDGEVPVIRADREPVRLKPADPGGMEIANRDKSVYDAISGKEEKELPKVIRIMPSAEEPISRDALKKEVPAAEPIEDATSENIAEDGETKVEETPAQVVASENIPAPKAEEVKKEEIKAENAPVVAVKEEKPAAASVEQTAKVAPAAGVAEIITETKPVEQKPVEKAVEPIKIVSVPVKEQPIVQEAAAASGYRVQLGSYRSQEDVLASWNVIKAKHGDLLKGAQMRTEKADLGSKGVFFRLQAGEFSSESESRRICNELKAKNQGCFIVKK